MNLFDYAGIPLKPLPSTVVATPDPGRRLREAHLTCGVCHEISPAAAWPRFNEEGRIGLVCPECNMLTEVTDDN